jgi:enediyne biosynthesis protein E4
MARMRGLAPYVLCWSIAALAVCGVATPAAADGGVTLTNVAAELGIAYERVPTPERLAAQDAFFVNGGVPLPFPNVAAAAPQKPHGTPGVALFDYDGDHDLDIYVTNGPGADNSLYTNRLDEPAHGFTDDAVAAGVGARAQDSSGVCFGDLDNDGDEDLYVTGIGGPNLLFENRGNRKFRDITASAGVAGSGTNPSGCAFADFNNDGLLDILVGNTYTNWNNRFPALLPVNDAAAMEPNQLFLRDSADRSRVTFIDASESSGIRDLTDYPLGGTITWSVAAVDDDQDGDTDIIWADFQGRNPASAAVPYRGFVRILRNDGTGHFTDETQRLAIAPGSYQGLSFGDFDCDGNVDFFATNIGAWLGGFFSTSRWFLGDGAGGYSDPGVGPLNGLPLGWGTATSDYDNDGDQDVVFYGGDDRLTILAMDNPGTVLQNQGCSAGFLHDLDALATDHRLRSVNGVATGDLDGNGFEDVVTAATYRVEPVAERYLLFSDLIGPRGSVLDPIARVHLVMSVLPGTPNFLTYLPVSLLNGDLAVEMNSGGNGNGWAEVRLLGGAKVVSAGRSNRDGIGAVVRFTPAGGPPVLRPIAGGGSHASQGTFAAHFGFGAATHGTVEVLWPGGTRNRLYGLGRGERVRFPEIPCDFNQPLTSLVPYTLCVSTSLDRYRRSGLLTHGEQLRFFTSALLAFVAR